MIDDSSEEIDLENPIKKENEIRLEDLPKNLIILIMLNISKLKDLNHFALTSKKNYQLSLQEVILHNI